MDGLAGRLWSGGPSIPALVAAILLVAAVLGLLGLLGLLAVLQYRGVREGTAGFRDDFGGLDSVIWEIGDHSLGPETMARDRREAWKAGGGS